MPMWRYRFKKVFVPILVVLLVACDPLGSSATFEHTQVPTRTLLPSVPPPSVATQPPTFVPTRVLTATPLPTIRLSPTLLPTVPPTAVPTLVPTPTLAPLPQAEREQIFNQVWQLVRDRYLYTDYHGVDWNAVRDTYEPQVQAATTPEEFYRLMQAMIAVLSDDHSRFESPQQVAEDDQRSGGELRYAGIGVMVRDDPLGGVITRLARNGPAMQAGLQLRDVIVAVGTIAFTDTARFGTGGPNAAIRGTPGSMVELTVRSPVGNLRKVQIIRQIIPGDAFPPVEARRLAGTHIGLVAIDTFDRPNLAAMVRMQLEQLLDTGPLDGLILDLRNNSGGYVEAMLDTIGLFVNCDSIGTSGGRYASNTLHVPSGKTFAALDKVPIVVLISEDTVSAAEMFAAGMRVCTRARIVGTASAGNTENLLLHSLSDGSRLWLAEFAYRLPDGSMLEGHGVQPDRQVDAEWWRYTSRTDPQIQAALQELQAK